MASESVRSNTIRSDDSGKTDAPPSAPPKVTQRSFGPLGLGDPDELKLTNWEIETVIPDLIQRRVRLQTCHNYAEAFESCLSRWRLVSTFACRKQLNEMNECYMQYMYDPEVVRTTTAEYLRCRAEFRRTGKRADALWPHEQMQEKRERSIQAYAHRYGISVEPSASAGPAAAASNPKSAATSSASSASSPRENTR